MNWIVKNLHNNNTLKKKAQNNVYFNPLALLGMVCRSCMVISKLSIFLLNKYLQQVSSLHVHILTLKKEKKLVKGTIARMGKWSKKLKQTLVKFW